MKLEDAAAEVGMQAASLRHAIHRGSLVATMVDGVWWVSRVNLKRYLEQRPTREGKARKAWRDHRLPRKPDGVSQRDWSMFRQYVREDKTFQEIGDQHSMTDEGARKVVNRVLAVIGEPEPVP